MCALYNFIYKKMIHHKISKKASMCALHDLIGAPLYFTLIEQMQDIMSHPE